MLKQIEPRGIKVLDEQKERRLEWNRHKNTREGWNVFTHVGGEFGFFPLPS